MPAHTRIDEILSRVRGEYLEMPGLRLTTAQAQCLWNLDPNECDTILTVLVEVKFLRRTRDGAFVRFESGSVVARNGRGDPTRTSS